jgi:hypothetical protein
LQDLLVEASIIARLYNPEFTAAHLQRMVAKFNGALERVPNESMQMNRGTA